MAKKTVQKIDSLTIVSQCHIQIIDESGETPKFKTVVKNCTDTPRHIAQAVKKAKISDPSYWVYRPGGWRTLEKVTAGLSAKM